MPLTVAITGYVPPKGVPLTMAAIRKLASGFTVTISGTVSGGEVVDGSITPAKVSPGAYFYGVATFASDIYSVTLSPPLTGLADGVKVLFKAPSANGPVEPKLVVNGLPNAGGVTIRKRLGNKLVAGEIIPGQIIEVTYNSSNVAHWEISANSLYERQDYGLTEGTVTSNRCSAYELNLEVDWPTLYQWAGRTWHARLHADCNANPTIKLGGGTAVALRWMDGRSIAQSQLRKGQLIAFSYDTLLGQFLVVGEQPSGLFGALETSNSATAWVASIPGLPESPVVGLGVLLKIATPNTGAVTFAPSSPASATTHGPHPVRKFGGRALDSGDVKAGHVVMVFDGTYWILQTPSCQPVIMAMANFDGTLTGPIAPRVGYNIDATAKIAKNATGDYTINFATALPSNLYTVHVTCGPNATPRAVLGGIESAANRLAGSVRIKTYQMDPVNMPLTDADEINVTVFGYP